MCPHGDEVSVGSHRVVARFTGLGMCGLKAGKIKALWSQFVTVQQKSGKAGR